MYHIRPTHSLSTPLHQIEECRHTDVFIRIYSGAYRSNHWTHPEYTSVRVVCIKKLQIPVRIWFLHQSVVRSPCGPTLPESVHVQQHAGTTIPAFMEQVKCQSFRKNNSDIYYWIKLIKFSEKNVSFIAYCRFLPASHKRHAPNGYEIVREVAKIIYVVIR